MRRQKILSNQDYLFKNKWYQQDLKQINLSTRILIICQIQLILYSKMYNHHNAVSEFLHLPAEAFLFHPYFSGKDNIRDDFKIAGTKKNRRLLFQGWAQETYTAYQCSQLQKLEQYLQNRNIRLDQRWNKAWKLKYLLSTSCDVQKCVEDMQRFTSQYMQRVKQIHFSRNISRLLGEGIFYICGKDSHYRPIIVFNVEKIVKLKCTEQEMLDAQVYMLEYVIKHYFIPGQVQNWVAIIDSGYQGLFSMIESMKKAFSFLSDNYRSRLFACYNVRITTSISIIWGIVKNFLDPETIQKINLFDENIPEPLFEYCNPSQVQERFGGKMANIPQGHFWPPKQWSLQYKYQKSPVKYMTNQQYTDFYQSGKLHDTKVHEQNLIKVVSTQLRHNQQLHTLKLIQRQFRGETQFHIQDQVVHEKDIEPFSKIIQPLSYLKLMSKRAKND